MTGELNIVRGGNGLGDNSVYRYTPVQDGALKTLSNAVADSPYKKPKPTYMVDTDPVLNDTYDRKQVLEQAKLRKNDQLRDLSPAERYDLKDLDRAVDVRNAVVSGAGAGGDANNKNNINSDNNRHYEEFDRGS